MLEYVIAKYIRLSIEDVITDSLSIPNQHKLLDKHIDELEIPNATILEFVDNGHSATTMDRPALQEMIELVHRGGINCIVIKDFSRFSRNALESGYFIERVCPFFSIRFISVSDNFDTNEYRGDTGGIDITFKYLLHEFYSKDLSNKVKSVKRNQMARGANIVANAIYGYRKNDKGKWEPDPVPADVVKQIFQMALDGMATAQIRDRLSELQYPTPREYIEKKRGKEVIPKCVWTARMVFHMLTNEQYTGTYIAGKQESKAVGSHSKNLIDKSKWIIFPDSHPPIVSKEDFLRVQALLEYRKGSTTAKPVASPLTDDKRSRRQRMMNGESIAATPIYGYLKTETGSWDIDEPAAIVVRIIFDMAAQESSYAEIIDRLFELGHPNPSEYIKLSRGHDITPTNRWTLKCIRGILKNEQYTGSYVSGKILKDYETGRSYHTPKNEWIVIPDKHPAIVSKDVFAVVQQLTEKRRVKRKNMQRRDYLLNGKIACGCCGYALMYDDSSDNKVYRCHHTHSDPSAICHKMKADALELEGVVIDIIKKQAEVVLGIADLSGLTKPNEAVRMNADYETQLAEVQKQFKEVYNQYLAQKIHLEAFMSLKKGCTDKIDWLNKQIAIAKKSQLDKITLQKSTEIARDALSESAIPRKLVEALIDKIYLFPEYQLEINWKVADFAIAP